MKNTITYKGYTGSIEFSEEDCVFFGKVLGIRSLISYEGESASALLKDFHEAVDDYLEDCKEKGQNPEKAYKGSFNVRFSSELHQKAALQAANEGITLNQFVVSAVESKLQIG